MYQLTKHICKGKLLGLAFAFISLSVFAQQEKSFQYFIEEIDRLEQKIDTSKIRLIFAEGKSWALQEKISLGDPDYLEFRLMETRYLMRYSKVSVDESISKYHGIYADAKASEVFTVQTKALGFLANSYRSKRELGKAFEYNQKEIQTARLSLDSLLLGRALITELDIAYNSLPSPMRPEDLEDLIAKGEYVISYSEEKNLNSILSFGKLYLSKFYIKQGEFEEANKILNTISNDDSLSVVFSKYEHLCEIAKQTKNLKLYRDYTLAFKSKAYETKRAFVALNAHNYLLDYSLQVQDADSSRYYAEQLEQNLAEVDTTKYLDFLDVSYTTLANYYRGRDVNKELQYLSYSTKINKTISRRQKEAFSAILKYNNEVTQLEKQNSSLTEVNSFFKNNLFASLTLLLLLVILVFVILKKYRDSNKRTATAMLEKRRIEETVTRKNLELNNKQRIYLDDLKYLKADRNYVEFYTEDKRIVDRGVLSGILEQLPPNFIQVHRSYVINKNFIKSKSGAVVVLLPNIEIPLSRTYKNRLNDSL